MVYSVAVRDKQRGRGSGGLITLIKKEFPFEILDTSNLWIFIKIQITQNMTLTVGNVYVSPNYPLEAPMESLDILLSELNTQSDPFIIGGDANGRIADENYLDENLAEEYGLLSQRISKDVVKNRRGEQLITCLEDHGFLVLNGRTEGDVPGQYTFLSRVGLSTVDLVWANLESCKLVSELRVSDTVIVSDHLPVTLTLNVLHEEQQPTSSQPKVKKFKWLPEKAVEFSEQVNNAAKPSQAQDVYVELVKTIEKAASDTGMIQELIIPTQPNVNKPWYSKSCRDLKKRSRQMLRKWKNKNCQEYLVLYLELKKDYFRVCSELKKLHDQEIKQKLANIRNPPEFWKVVKQFKPKAPNKSKLIPIEEWSCYLEQMFRSEHINSRNVQPVVFTDVLRQQMDSDFCMGELEKGISHLKSNKSPGPDNVLNEYLKVLHQDWKSHLLCFINFIFNGGNIPDTLTDSFMFMLFKKGDPSICANYRNIALMNNILKLITHLVTQRVLAWSEDNGVFSEAQAGFRPGRGCTDNIFTLQSIVSLHLINKRKLYAAFIDYKSAFPEIQHDLLFAKMFAFGISGKVISLFRRIYKGATTQIRVEDKTTPSQEITKGVLQGDCGSPVAFVIFINDLEDYFRKKGAEGVSITSSTDILLLLYCDDLIIFASSKVDMQRKLNILSLYCEENKMTVNESKSNIVVFRRGGRLADSDTFLYNNKPLQVSSEYVYLGVKLSSHGVFHKAALQAISKGRMAIASVKNILVNSRMTSQESRMQLFQSIVCATLLYGAEIWGSRYEDMIEVVQSQFLKSVFCLPRCTPHYMVRLEFGVVKLAYHVLKQMLRWWLKLLSMPEERFPRKCYNQLVVVDQLSRNVEKFNWVTLLKRKLVQLDYAEIWEAQSHELLKDRIGEILDRYEIQLVEQDYRRLQSSSYCTLYKELKPNPGIEEMKPKTSSYFSLMGPIDRTRVVAQIRLVQNSKVNFYINRMAYNWSSEEQCSVCNLHENEDLYHFLFKCPHFSELRSTYLEKWLTEGRCSVEDVVRNPSQMDINNLYFYILGALKIRAFLRNE